MIKLKPAKRHYREVQRWSKDPDLVQQICGPTTDNAVVPLPATYEYLTVWKYDTLIGVTAYEEVTKVCFNVHGGLFPKYQVDTNAVETLKSFIEYIQQHTLATCLVWTIPVECIWVHRLLMKLEIPMTGKIPQGIVYNNKLQDLLIFSKIIDRR